MDNNTNYKIKYEKYKKKYLQLKNKNGGSFGDENFLILVPQKLYDTIVPENSRIQGSERLIIPIKCTDLIKNIAGISWIVNKNVDGVTESSICLGSKIQSTAQTILDAKREFEKSELGKQVTEIGKNVFSKASSEIAGNIKSPENKKIFTGITNTLSSALDTKKQTGGGLLVSGENIINKLKSLSVDDRIIEKIKNDKKDILDNYTLVRFTRKLIGNSVIEFFKN